MALRIFPAISNSITACEREMASNLPADSELSSFIGVTSVANFTSIMGLPSMSRMGLQDAWIQTSSPCLFTRRYLPALNSPRAGVVGVAEQAVMLADHFFCVVTERAQEIINGTQYAPGQIEFDDGLHARW